MHNTLLLRKAAALSPIALSLVLAGCGGGDPAPAASASMSRTAASTASATTILDEEYATAIHHIYIAYFGRPAEPPGLTYWNRQFKQAAAPIAPDEMWRQYRANGGVRFVLQTFAASTESQELYPGGTAQFVDGVYRNLYKRAADLPGLAYWTDAIDRNLISRSEAALAIMVGAQGEDARTVRNKVAVSALFYRILSQDQVWVMAYTGARNNELVRRMLAQVDANTDLVAFEAVIRATIAQFTAGRP